MPMPLLLTADEPLGMIPLDPRLGKPVGDNPGKDVVPDTLPLP
jgi:hypothetical protein